MIEKSLQFTSKVLGQFFRNRFSLDEEKIVLNYLVEPNGSLPQVNQNKVVVSLINIEKETNQPSYVRSKKLENENYSGFNPIERYTLDILISSNFDNYSESLQFLDAVIYFFHVNNSLDPSSFAAFPAGLTKLEFEYEKISSDQMHHLWTAMGAKYRPSVIYKMRLTQVQTPEITETIPALKGINDDLAK
ncbi:DUF4255 domain-containing protein [Flavobacterium sp.]|uniref:DUF4255 domain-containing protein n=1 Tax=Flavobacterium sp. TaxID=239 RepID=UPI003D0A723C